MKPLKEIGTPAYDVRDFPFPSKESIGRHYTNDERRELVRILLSKGFSAGMTHADCKNYFECEADFIEEFIKEQGL